MPQDHLNILFTSVGRRVELVRLFSEARERLGLTGKNIAINLDVRAAGMHFADRSIQVVPVTSDEYVPMVVQICRDEAIDLIVPLIEPEVKILGDARKEIEATHATLPGVGEEGIEITYDKWLTYEFFQNLQIPAPQSWLPSHLPDTNISFPLFIKPRSGSASQSTFRINNRDELDFFVKYVPNPIIQDFLSGPEITTDVVCDRNGNTLSLVSRERLEVRAGEVAIGRTVFREDIARDCQLIASKLQAVGPISIQCIIRDDIPCYIEVNGRVGGGFPLGIAAGGEGISLFLAHLAGIEVDIPPLGSYRRGLIMSRYDESLFFHEDTLSKCEICHLRPR